MSDERELLEARARALAAPPPVDAAPGAALDVVVFTLGGERFAVEATHVLEAMPLIAPTPVPGERPWLIGVVAHRGRVLGGLDLRPGLAPGAGGELGYVVAVTAEGQTFGIAAERVEETCRLDENELAVAASGPYRGVTEDRLTVLDLEALARDSRLRIDEAELT
jgi:purine-binding chemotaxis protein CheW